jgi:D-2-hydroxyacid dehydrogenase (NADP+)
MQLGIHESVGTLFPPDKLEAALAESMPDVGLRTVAEHDEVNVCDAVVTRDHHPAFLESEHLDWVHSVRPDAESFPTTELEAADVTLTTSTGLHGPSVAETVIGYMTMLARGLNQYAGAQADHEWDSLPWDRPFRLTDETVCIVGLGTIGQAIAERTTWMDMEVRGVRRSPEPAPIVDELYTTDEIHAAMYEARFVVLAVPPTASTRRLVGPAELTAMGEDAYLINVSRGDVVVESALVDALENDELAGAALDVFAEEPLPEDSPLWDFEDVLVTPHAAGQYRSYYQDVAELIAENVTRLEDDRQLRNTVA